MYKKLIIFVVIFFIMLMINTANAQTDNSRGEGNLPEYTGEKVDLGNPLNKGGGPLDGGVPAIIGRVINAVLGIVGSLALLMFVYGGLLWMTAGGRDEKITQGKNIIIWATLGLVVIFASYAIVKLLLTSLTGG